jgi:hypothetical protein
MDTALTRRFNAHRSAKTFYPLKGRSKIKEWSNPMLHSYSSAPALRTRLTQLGATILRAALTTLIVTTLSGGNAEAQIALTPATAAEGWTLTDFVHGFTTNGNSVGPLGIAFTDSGGVLIANDGAGSAATGGSVYLLPTDTDNQDITQFTPKALYGAGNAIGLARVGGNFYMTQQKNGQVVQLNPDGTFNQVIATLATATGITANPANGHLIVSLASYPGVWDVDPIAKKATRLFVLPYSYGDGLSTDGTTLYIESGGHILGYRLSDDAQIFDSGFIIGADGCILGAGTLSGYLFVNTNYGQVFQIDLSTQVITLIASGGSRGDFVAMDPNGSLLITLSGRIVRLTPPTGVGINAASVTLNPPSVTGSLTSVGTVTLTNPAPIGLSVTLTSVNAAASVPASVTVPAGAISAPFSITTTAVSTATVGSITATLNGGSASATLTVLPIGVAKLTLKPTSIKGGKAVSGTVTLAAPAAPGGITVTFVSSATGVVPSPVSITIPAGKQSATITVKTKQVTSSTSVTLSATANAITASATLVVTP